MSTSIGQGRNYRRKLDGPTISVESKTDRRHFNNRVAASKIRSLPNVECPPKDVCQQLPTVSQQPIDIPLDVAVMKKIGKMHRRRSIIRDFSLNTSTHGLPGIARSASAHNCLFWSTSFIIFTCVMIYFIVTAVLNYLTYPTQMEVNVVLERARFFPAFSICNGEPFRFDQVIGPFLNYTNFRNLTNSNDTTAVSKLQEGYIFDFLYEKMNRNESLLSFFFSLSSILHKCTYNSVDCLPTDFIPFISPSYGLCHTFNAKMKNSSEPNVRHGNQYGGDGNLELALYVHKHQYFPYYWNGFGMIALIHDNTQIPLIESAGIELSPGKKHKLGFKKKTTFLLPSPYTQCTDEVPLSMDIMLNNYYAGADYGYSQTVCFQLCQQTYAFKQCGCVSPMAWSARSVILPGTDHAILAPVCNDSNYCCYEAVDALLNSSSLQDEYCSKCSQQCSTTDFIVQTSGLETPLGWQLDEIKSFVENSTVPLATNWSANWQSEIEKNYLIISVVRETTIIENQTQTAKLGLVDVVSNIGGQTGLWIGISFLSIMEFIEMLYRLIRYQCHLIRQTMTRHP